MRRMIEWPGQRTPCLWPTSHPPFGHLLPQGEKEAGTISINLATDPKFLDGGLALAEKLLVWRAAV